MACLHRNSWAIAGGYWLWCYECGAVRQMSMTPPNISTPRGRWIKPVGKGGENPYRMLAAEEA